MHMTFVTKSTREVMNLSHIRNVMLGLEITYVIFVAKQVIQQQI